MRIGLIGVGNVGSTIAYSILQNEKIKFDRFVLYDIVPKVQGIRLDFCHAFPSRSERIIVGDYEELNDCDVVVITAGKPRTPDMTRMDLLDVNVKIFRSIFENFKPKKDAVLVVVTNPSDIMGYIAYKLSGLGKERLFGFGGDLDSSRYKFVLSQELGVPADKITNAYVIGEHGEGMIPVLSQTKVDGKPLGNSVDKNQIKEKVRESAKKVIELTGATLYGPGENMSKLIESIVNDKEDTHSVSTLLEGEYGVKDVFMTVPCVVGRNGIKKVVECKLNEGEKNQLLSLSEKLMGVQNQIVI